jgi:D-alanyl-D-alanine carboxypeptidase
VTRVSGSVLADERRLGSDETGDARAPLRVGRSAIEIRVRPADREGAAPYVSVRPDSEAFVIENHATTVGKGRRKVVVQLATVGSKMRVVVTGKMPEHAPVLVVRRKPSSQPLYVAALLRGALLQAGIEVKGGAGLYVPRTAEPRRTAMSLSHLDTPVALEPASRATVLAVHDSDPLPVLMRRINKDSDNEWAERLLETVGAEVYGGAATPAKGVRALREAITELGLPPNAYVPMNGSGLGHGNRITPEAMADLLRRLFLDPRLGPDMVQSLSVGGVDGTTRNRFRGSPAAERVRAKTGTLAGKSCLSGYVGDGSDILVFSIMVQGLRQRSLAMVRHAQVTAVNAMMRYARGAVGPAPGEEIAPTDVEGGDEPGEGESEETDPGSATASAPLASTAQTPRPPEATARRNPAPPR